jgi:3-deoxy-D-manno-octulosonate 8-phosphate phosphatase (KDO 8-P phosphatase)
MPGDQTLAQRCADIQLLVLDVDGVLTDGRIIYSDAGSEVKEFHVRDGSGLKLWHWLGKHAAIITGRTSRIVEVRAAELDVKHVIQGTPDKLPAFRRVLGELGLRAEQAAYVGDDLPDVPVMLECGLAIAVADACPETRAVAHYITNASGGRGAVREAIERILSAQGLWNKVLDRYVRGTRDAGHWASAPSRPQQGE